MGKFIKFLLVCLGFKSLTACEVFYGTDEYGTPYAEYEAKGRVSDSEGTPISGIKVSMGDEYGMDSVAVSTSFTEHSRSGTILLTFSLRT